MKKKITTLITLIIITLLGIIIILNNKNKTYELKDDNDGQFAFYYEDENGEYYGSTDSKWDSGNYVLNLENTICDGENNPSFLSWNKDNNSVTLTRNKATSCSLYFDLKNYARICKDNSLACYIAKKQGTQTGDKVGEELLYHNNTIDINGDGKPDDAGDLSYRYSGDNPDNFVCFGSDQNPCPTENLYRILGVFPITKEDGSVEYQVKLIKSEYITQDELGLARYGTKNMGTNEHEMVASITPRVSKTTGVDTFLWTNTTDHLNNWNLSPIKEKLNDTKEGYLSHLDTKWQDMIFESTWYIGGFESGKTSNSKSFYDYELGDNKIKENDVLCINNTTTLVPCTKALLETKAKVGLMYATDYRYASKSSNWNISSYADLLNRENNWLYNGFYEYFITRLAGTVSNIVDMDVWGYLAGTYRAYGESVRPVFYLNSDVKYISGAGTAINPYIITDNFSYEFVNDIQVFTAPVTGDYKLEVWGAQGGISEDYAKEGKGGYSTGTISLKAGEKLYVVVGGQGSSTLTNGVYKGGYNGGGDGASGQLNQYAYGGGGATHIAKSTGLLSSLSNKTGDILIVAGGGGGNGAFDTYGGASGGAGGGTQGVNGFDSVNNNSSWFNGSRGTQTSAGRCPENLSDLNCGGFGQGGSATGQTYGGAGGGGGFYGGSQSDRGHAGGGGGSGYIGNSNLNNGKTIAGNTQMPSPDGNTEIGHSGNGFAKITLIS